MYAFIWKWNESGFRPVLCTYRLNWARGTSWEWWDERDDTVLQTQDSKFEPWRSEVEHATSRSRLCGAFAVILHGKKLVILDVVESVINRFTLTNLFNAGIDVTRQNLTSIDVRFWRVTSISTRDRRYTSESDVHRRQILTCNVDLHAERVTYL